MARAVPALEIVVGRGWLTHPEIVALRELGHHVTSYGGVDAPAEPDLILHPAAHGWDDELFGGPYLKTALSAARKRHRERKKK